MALTAALCFVACFLSVVNADCGRNSSTSTIGNTDDASALSSCTTFSGSLAIATDVAGDVKFPGIQEILGDLVVKDAVDVTSVSASDLRRLDGTLNVDNATKITSLSFPALTEAGGITFIALANLAEFDFTAGITTVSKVDIENTFLKSLDDFNLLNPNVLVIANNGLLDTINLPLQTAPDNLTVQANGRNCTLTLENLTSAGNMTIQDVSQLSLPSLGFVSGSLDIAENTMSELDLKSLNVVKGNLDIDQNSGLLNVSMTTLLSVGKDLWVDGDIVFLGLDRLSSAGSVNISSPLQNLTMPALKSVDGDFTINSTSEVAFDCLPFGDYLAFSYIKGNYSCNGAAFYAAPVAVKPYHGKRLSGGAIGGIVVGTLVALVAFSIGAFLIWRRRKASRKPDDSAGQEPQMDSESPLEKDGAQFAYLLKEMPTGEERHEIAEQHGFSETAGQPRYELPGNNEQDTATASRR